MVDHSTTAREDIIQALESIPADASLTLDQLTKGTSKARETLRGAARQLVLANIIDRVPVEGVNAYRLRSAPSTRAKQKRVESSSDVSREDLVAELRCLYEQKLKLELQINKIEQRLAR